MCWVREGWQRVRFIFPQMAGEQSALAVETVNQGPREEARYRREFDVVYEESPDDDLVVGEFQRTSSWKSSLAW